MANEEHWEIIRRLADIAEKLLAETVRLRGDILRLHGRIEPFEDEVKVTELPSEWPKPRNLKDALWMISDARENILYGENHLSAIRGKLDGIASDAISREEMKPWLKRR